MKQTKSEKFSSLYNQQFPQLVQSLIVRYRLPHEVAEDIVQNVLTDTWAALTACEESDVDVILSVPYIKRKCKNCAAKHLSQCMRYKMVPLFCNDENENDIVSSTIEYDAWQHKDNESVAESVKAFRIHAIKHHLLGLSVEHRMLILRRVFNHEPYCELAESLGFKNGNVCKQVVCRDCSRIRNKVQEEALTFAA